ncbi:hypothetical protein J4234_01675 [Candidatus Woesearchaeota archaeon]|nr:hypothetical protein [Candidatus Woesearchaeota archaeon]
MTIQEEIQRILELWYNNIKPEARGDLSNLWEHRAELGELEAIVERLEPKVIKLLEVIPTLKRHSHEYHARTVDLVKLLHHFNKYSKDEWIQKVTSDLDYMSKEITQARNQAEGILRSKRHEERQGWQDRSYLKKPTIDYKELEDVGYEILKTIYPQGRAHPLSRLSNLRQWLNQKYQSVKVHPLIEAGVGDLWLLVVLTLDEKYGIAVPALDSVIGSGGLIMEYYEGGRYNGTQMLTDGNILTLAKAEYDSSNREWRAKEKGRIQLSSY